MARLKMIAARTFSWAFGLCWSLGIVLGLWAVRHQVIADLGQNSALFFFGVPSLLLTLVLLLMIAALRALFEAIVITVALVPMQLLFSMRKAAREQAK